MYNESTEEEGSFNISLTIKRKEGVMGNITVRLYQSAPIIYSFQPESESLLLYKYSFSLSFTLGALADRE